MAKILCTGIATLDIVNEVASYPLEDDEIRILAQDRRRGGNAANTAVVLSQLGHQCFWAGTLVNETDSLIILNDFDHYQVNYQYCQFLPQGKIPTSYITLSRETGSRTISHFRDLPEFSFEEFKKINLALFDWYHFEGRNIEETLKMITYTRKQYPDKAISVEIEKARENCADLIQLADIILFSRHYAVTQEFTSAKDFCQHMSTLYLHKTIICAWGSSGAAASDKQHYYWQDAPKVHAIDTLAAGDVFNASIIDQQIKQQNMQQSLANACKLAATKCTQKGICLI
ncbi:MAG: PfkB family carbohydrate kinase [Gammaproteobacteria bacterium]|nr:PfkB family carbohydrate kinase [Gammaproteobacteria bacterium]